MKISINKKHGLIAGLLCVGVAVGVASGFGYFKRNQLLDATSTYLEEQGPIGANKVMDGYGMLQAVGLRDRPGYSVALGGTGAFIRATELLESESQMMMQITSNPMYFTLASGVKGCLQGLHAKRTGQIETLKEFSMSRYAGIKNRDFYQALDDINWQGQQECLATFSAAHGRAGTTISVDGVSQNAVEMESMIERYQEFHSTKIFADWEESDMLEAIAILIDQKNEDDRKAFKEEAKAVLSEQCSTGSCVIQQTEFRAASLILNGRAKTPVEALRMLK